jgi:very-short-patch-repair endonuclease
MKTALSQERAQALRQEMTEAETKLWLHLRNRQIDGVKFRR